MFVVIFTEKVTDPADCLSKKGLSNLDYNVWCSNFPKYITNISVHDHDGVFSNHFCKVFGR